MALDCRRQIAAGLRQDRIRPRFGRGFSSCTRRILELSPNLLDRNFLPEQLGRPALLFAEKTGDEMERCHVLVFEPQGFVGRISEHAFGCPAQGER